MIARSNARIERWSLISSFVAVPSLLAILTATQSRLQNRITEFLVLPPFAVVIYLIFRDPLGKSSNLRSIVVLPCMGAAVGELCFRYLGFTPVGIAVDSLIVLSLQSVIKARMPPAFALSVLAMLLRVDSLNYVLGVAEASTVIAIPFFLWRSWLILPLLREEPVSVFETETASTLESSPPNASPRVP
ncbi:MAG: HPP family protein [Candidatus Elarobacter sp.]